MIVTSAERANDSRKPPVYISGFQGTASTAEHFVFSRTGLGVSQQPEYDYKAPTNELGTHLPSTSLSAGFEGAVPLTPGLLRPQPRQIHTRRPYSRRPPSPTPPAGEVFFAVSPVALPRVEGEEEDPQEQAEKRPEPGPGKGGHTGGEEPEQDSPGGNGGQP